MCTRITAVRAFNVNKPKVLQIYDKIMKLCLNSITFILVINLKEISMEITKSLTLALFCAYFFLYKPQ